MTNDAIKNIVRKIESLPTLPTTYSRINELMNRPTTCAMDIADVISRDQVLTARLLKLVNSAFYGFSGKIKTVSGAVVVLGFKAIKSLVLSSSVLDLFKEKEANPLFEPVSFWKHSLAVAACSKLIAKYLDYDDPEEFFVAGLLHDIGKIILNQFFKQEFYEVLVFSRKEKITLVEAEMQKFQACHSDTGLLLCEKWRLPDCVKEAVAYHHSPEAFQNYPLFPSVVHLADILVKSMELGSSGDPFVNMISNHAWTTLNIPLSQLEPIMQKLKIETMDIFNILNPSFKGVL